MFRCWSASGWSRSPRSRFRGMANRSGSRRSRARFVLRRYCRRRMGCDRDTAIGGARDRFPSTQLSLIEAAAGGLPNEALERVIALYWKPVYAFIRARWHMENEAVEDLT